ncbi:MAG: hypothetical protein R2752_12420 [Vicinamibacterales bacterium]
MRIASQRTRPAAAALVAAAFAVLAMPVSARAQQFDRPVTPGLGENYHAEIAFTFWNPALNGIVASEQFGIAGDDVNFVSDLGFEQKRFREMKIVLRPAKKHRFRLQYTPISYTADARLSRSIVFNGQNFDVSLPVSSQFDWKVWRIGYEYDAYYTPRGFIGVLFDVRQTRLNARLASPVAEEFTTASAPLPAIGVVGRVYPLPELAINFEVSGMRLPDIGQDYTNSAGLTIPKYEANYFDWDINGTVNLGENVGLQMGWRRITTLLRIESDKGDVKFQGLYFGAALRY